MALVDANTEREDSTSSLCNTEVQDRGHILKYNLWSGFGGIRCASTSKKEFLQ